MTDKPYKEKFATQLSLYRRLEPYQYFEIYLLTAQAAIDMDYDRMERMSIKEKSALTNFVRLAEIAFHSDECKIFEFGDDLKPLLEDTKPSYVDLHLPYPAMFVSKKFETEHFIFNGFLLMDRDYFRDVLGYRIEDTDAYSGYDGTARLLCVILNKKGEYEFYSIEALTEKRSPKATDFFDSSEERKDMRKAAKMINTIAANLVQTIINDEKDIQMVEIKYTKEHNEKRKKRGKPLFRDKIILRLGGELKRYAEYYSKYRGGIMPRHLVMGHFMHFRSDRYVYKKGQKVWKMPYWRGSGETDLKRFVEVINERED